MGIIQLSFQNEKRMCLNFSPIVKFPRYWARRKDGRKLWIVRMQVTALRSFVDFLRPTISYRTENSLSFILVVVQVWFIPEQWFRTVSYRKIQFRCVLGTGIVYFSPSGARINFFGYPVHNLRNGKRVDDFLRIVPPRETLVGWEEYLPCILRWIILEGHDRPDGQTNI
jgi:hypothetical protein